MDPKSGFKSMTVWGIIAALIGWAKTKFGWDITESDIEEGFNVILTVGGAVTAYLGRRRATGPLKIILLCMMLPLSGCVSSFATFENRKAQVAMRLAEKAHLFTATVRSLDTAHDLKLISDSVYLALDPMVQSTNTALNTSRKFFDAGDIEAADQEILYFDSLQAQLKLLIDDAIRKQIERNSTKPTSKDVGPGLSRRL